MPNPSNRQRRTQEEACRGGRRISHVVGFDDAPFDRSHRGDVLVVGAVFAGKRLDGVISTRVRRDGANAAQRLTDCLTGSKYYDQLQAVLLQGIAFAGFNVVDLQRLHQATRLPVLVVVRHQPDFQAIREALLQRVTGGARKWRLIEAAGPMEQVAGLYVQRCGITPENTAKLLAGLQQNAQLPEPLRVAHMIAGGVTTGESRHRA
jgi:endonuclease V-like protein UPF0215 family